MADPITWSHIASGLGTITIIMVGYQINRSGKHEDKLDDLSEKLSTMITEDKCRQHRKDCLACAKVSEVKSERKDAWDKHDHDTKEFRDKFYKHGHSGLPDDSVVRLK